MRTYLRNQSGVAMLMAITTMLVLSLLAAELVYQTEVYNSTVFSARDQLRTRLLARSALKMAILQLHGTSIAKEKLKSVNKELVGLSDKIWQTQIVMPPPELKGMGVAEQEAFDKFKKSLKFDGSFTITILADSDKMALNELVWLNQEQGTQAATGGSASGGTTVGAGPQLTPEQKQEALKKSRQKFVSVLNELLEQKRKNDDAFREQYQTLTGDTLIGNLVAFMDPEVKTDGDNRDKDDYYTRYEPTPYALKNAPLVSDSELHMVKGFDDEIVKLVTDNFTINSTTGLNINKISKALLHALIPELNEDELETVLKRRADPTLGAFNSEEDFWKYLDAEIFRDSQRTNDVKKRFGEQGHKFVSEETSFRVIVTAKSGNSNRTWLAYVGPTPPAEKKTNVPGQQSPNTRSTNPGGMSIDKSADENAAAADKQNKDSQKNDKKLPRIIYLKAD